MGGVGVKVMCTQGLTLAWVWDVLVLTRLEERGRLSALGSLIKGLQGREQATRVKITHTLYRAAGIREPEREEEIDSEGEGGVRGGGQEGWGRAGWRVAEREKEGRASWILQLKLFFFFLLHLLYGFTRACHSQREMEHYCNSTETENNIKPSLSKRCFEGKDAIIKTSPRQRAAEKPLSETRLSDLSFSLSPSVSLGLFVSGPLCLCVWEIWRERRGVDSGDKVTHKERKWWKMSGRMLWR